MRIAEQLKAECLRRLDEGKARIGTCLGMLPHEQLWRAPNAHAVSAGHLVLHLCGNVGQWVTSTLGGLPDHRDREKEFDPASAIPKAELEARLEATLEQARQVIAGLSEEQLASTYRVQGFAESGTAILVHVVEHFSYHTGQITLHTKLALDADTGYYAGLDLNAKG